MSKRLPRQIAAQAQEADALEAQMYQQPQTPAEPEPAAPAPVAPVMAPANPDEDPNSPTWQQRYRTLQGEFNAKVPRLQADLKESTQRMEAMQRQLDELSARREPQRFTTDKDADEFGPEMLDLIGRRAREIAAEENAELRQQLAELKTQLNATGQTVGDLAQAQVASASDRFYSDLNRAVPDWETINTRADWLQWLNEEDPFSGATRQAALDAASGNLDARRVSMIFNAFKAQTAQAAPAPAPTRDTLSGQVAPARTAAPAPSAAPQNVEIIAGSEITAFYENVRRGKFTVEQRAAIEQTINLAMAEGRIDPNR